MVSHALRWDQLALQSFALMSSAVPGHPCGSCRAGNTASFDRTGTAIAFSPSTSSTYSTIHAVAHAQLAKPGRMFIPVGEDSQGTGF